MVMYKQDLFFFLLYKVANCASVLIKSVLPLASGEACVQMGNKKGEKKVKRCQN